MPETSVPEPQQSHRQEPKEPLRSAGQTRGPAPPTAGRLARDPVFLRAARSILERYVSYLRSEDIGRENG